MEASLQGKVGVVSGGAKVIGAAVVRRLSNDGAQVIVADIDEKNGTDISKFTPEKNTYDALYSDLAVRLYKAAGKQKEDIFSLTLPRLKAAAALEKAGITAR